MRFLSVAHTDKGLNKAINQDAFCLKIAKTPTANVAFAVICDGVSGLSSGETASAFVVNAFSRWFDSEFSAVADKNMPIENIASRWKAIAVEQGRKILEYGKAHGMSLGTTLTAFLIMNDRYVSAHVGDCRLYKIDDRMRQLTKDQTVAAYEVMRQRMTVEEVENDGRSRMLLQCLGVSKAIDPEIQTGKVAENDAFMLCSDGFIHRVSEAEIYGIIAPPLLTSEKVMKKSLVDLVDLNKARNEKDNITVILIKAIR